MNIRKLPSGKWNARKMFKGKNYSVTYDKKPTMSQAELDLALLIQKAQENGDELKKVNLTVKDACRQYIDVKKNVLSPTTILGYERYLKNLPADLAKRKIDELDLPTMQKFVNDFFKDHSEKYTKNVYNFVTSAVKMFRENYKVVCTLPKKQVSTYYEPSDDDVRKLLNASKSTDYELAIQLGCYGVSRSEMCAITAQDIDGDILTINKAKVMNADGEWIIKPTSKTKTRNRQIAIGKKLAAAIVEKGCVYDGYPNSITCFMYDTEDRLGIPRFSLHKLRHYFVAKMIDKIPLADLMATGGWATDFVMKQHYLYSLSKEKDQKREIASKIQNAIFDD